MNLSIADARAFAKMLNDAADNAEALGQPMVDLTASMQSLDNEARADLQDAIDHAKKQIGE